jgi:hypothetical protein
VPDQPAEGWCLFCRSALTGATTIGNDEHMVPQVLGGNGWLTIRLLCVDCNSRLGHDVDKVGNNPWFVPLRAEAGLPAEQALRARVRLPGSDEWVSGLYRFGRGFEADERVKDDGLNVHVQAGSRARAIARAEDVAHKRLRRQKRTVKFGEPEEFTGGGPVLLDQAAARPEELNELLPREVAKIAIEYVAYISSADVALDPRLDSIRRGARYGEPFEWRGSTAGLNRLVYLPRMDFWTQLGAEGTPKPSDDDLWASAEAPDGTRRETPADAYHLTHLAHELGVWRDNAGGHFQLILFSWLSYLLDLPADLPIPWGRYHIRDFTRRRFRSGFA